MLGVRMGTQLGLTAPGGAVAGVTAKKWLLDQIGRNFPIARGVQVVTSPTTYQYALDADGVLQNWVNCVNSRGVKCSAVPGARLATTVAQGALNEGESLANTGFASATGWGVNTGWAINTVDEIATHTPGNTGALYQNVNGGTVTAGEHWQLTYVIHSDYSAGGCAIKLAGSSQTYRYAAGTYTDVVKTVNTNGQVQLVPTSTFAGSISLVSAIRVYPTVYDTDINGNSLPNVKGQLVEPETQNLFKYSQDQSQAAVWVPVSAAGSANQAVAPDGTMTATFVTSGIAGSYLYQFISAVAGNNYEVSYYFKPTTAPSFTIQCNGNWFADATFRTLKYTVATDSVAVTGGTFLDYGVEDAPNGYKRVWGIVTGTITNASAQIRLRTEDGGHYYGWGAQAAIGSALTSYMPTGASVATREAVNLTVPTAGVLPVNDFGVMGRVIPNSENQPSQSLFASYSDGNNEIQIFVTATTVQAQKRIAGATTASASVAYTHATGTPFEYQLYQAKGIGFGLRVKEEGAGWSAWDEQTDADGKVDAVIATNLQIGARNNATYFAGTYGDTQIVQTADPKAFMEKNWSNGSLFAPFGSDALITSDGKTFYSA